MNERSTKLAKTVSEPPNSNSLASAEKLDRILRHAAQVFASRGYEGASIRDISRSSGISLSGLYYYVKSKQEILYLIQIHTFKTILSRLQDSLRGVREPAERLRIFVRNHLGYFLQHPMEMKVLAHEDDALEGAFRKGVAEIKRKYYGIAVEIFEALRDENPSCEVRPRVAVLSLFGMMNWIHTWYQPQRDPQAEELSAAMSDMFLHGVTNGRQPASRAARSRSVNATARIAV